MTNDLDPTPFTLARLGGMLGISAALIGIALFLVGCFGFDAAFRLGNVPLLMAAGGMIVSIVGGIKRFRGHDETGILAAVWVNLFGLVGGLLLVAVANDWDIVYRAARP